MKEIIFSRRNELLRIPFAKAMFYEAYGNYCYAVFPNKQKVMIPVSLTQMEEIISANASPDMPLFIRIGKRFIVKTDVVVQLNFSKQQLILSDFDHPGSFALPVSKEALKQVKNLYETKKIWK